MWLIMKSTYVRAIFGLVFFIGAFILLGISCGWFQIIENFTFAWIFILPIIGIIWMITFGVNIFNSIIIFTGLGFILLETGIVPSERIIQLIITLALLSIGLTILGSIGKLPTEVTIFSKKLREIISQVASVKAMLISKNFLHKSEQVKEGIFKVTFCNVAYNMSNVKLDQNINIKVNVIGGKLILLLPKGYKIISNSSASFGHVTNCIDNKPEDSQHIIFLNANVKFGEVILKNEPFTVS